jgi:histidine triad (HIT) family protein
MTIQGCVFCAIARGRAPASVVLRDRWTVAFMDIRQRNEGHLLVVPRRHARDLYALRPAEGAALMRAVLRVARAVRRAFRPHGLSVWLSTGRAAGQEIFHVHAHVLPRWRGDRLFRIWTRPPLSPGRTALDAQAARLRRALRRSG